MIKRVSIGLLFFLLAFLCYVGDVQADFNPLDLNGNEIADKDEAEVIVNSNVTLPSGEYFFNNLIISNNSVLTAEGDTNSASLFKGVKINAVNLTVLDGSSISADGEGYLPGGSPGSSISIQAGASYGGVGGWGGMSTYGSATHPTDLGSGSPYAGRGGGAIWLQVSETLTNEGVVSANGERSSSGGSIYLVSGSLAGSGVFEAKGGGYSWSSIYYGLGGGGRIAVYYGASSFSGESSASGGCGSLGMGYPYECAGSGTVGFFDTAANNFISGALWRFQQNDSPFNFNDIILSGGSETEIEDGANLSANNLTVNETSSLVIFGSPMLSIPTILIDGNSTITLSEKTLTAKSLTVTGNSIVTVAPEKILSLEIADITVDFGSSISADEKGYGYGTGLGAPDFNHYWAGASYGGVGYGNTSESVYGSEREPTDFGSGGNSGQNPRGGGAIRVISSGSFINNGAVSANGGSTSSGGSVYVSASNLTGGGAFYANGGNNYCSNSCFGSGGGGRIAVYYENSTFSGEAAALAGMYCFYGCSRLGENGTVVMEQTSPACTTDCFSNVLFLPGLMGSRLYEQGGLMDCSNLDPGTTPPMECFYDKELWVSRDDSNQTELGLDTNGKSINDIYTKNDTQNNGETDETGIIDDIYLSNIYQSFIYDLRDWKQNGLINEYAFIPYDWRLSLEDIITGGSASSDGNLFYTNTQDFSESFILKKLDELQKTSKSGKVTIVAHSNGGLVTKALVQKLQDTNNPLYEKIDKIIFVAVPQIGTPDALVGLLHGTELGFGFLMDKERSRQLAENMPTVYNLLPSNSYFTTVDPAFAVGKLVSFENTPFFNPQTSQYGVFVSNETELKNYVLGTDGRTKPSFGDTVHPNIGNSVLYDQAENVHQILDSWQPSPDTKVIQVAGWGEETLAGIDYKSIGGDATERLSYKPRMVVDGDGTVVVPSALWMATSSPNIERWWVDLKIYNAPIIGIDREHRDILEIPVLLDFIKSKITNSISFSDPENIVVSNPSFLVSNGIHLHYTLHSPLTLGITDSEDRYTGMDPLTYEIKQEIPNVTYKQIGEVQFISVPASVPYTLKMYGYGQGNFALDVEKQLGNDVLATTSFQGIPSSVSTIATMNIPTDFEIGNSVLNIDNNGDNTIDKTLPATLGGTTIYDIAAPEVSISFDITNKDVVYSAIDTSPTTVIHSNTNITATDNQGNISILNFTKYKEKPTKLKLLFNTIVRSGISTVFPKTNIQYNWAEKKGALTDLDTKVVVKGKEKYVFNYKKATNTTIIKEKTGNGINRTTRQGFVAVTITTNGDEVRVDY